MSAVPCAIIWSEFVYIKSIKFRMCEKFHQLLAVGRWFPPGTPVSSTRKLISSSSFHRLDMTLAVAEALNPNKPNLIVSGRLFNYLFKACHMLKAF